MQKFLPSLIASFGNIGQGIQECKINNNIKSTSQFAYFILKDMITMEKKKVYRFYSQFDHFWGYEAEQTEYNGSKLVKWMGETLQKFDDD